MLLYYFYTFLITGLINIFPVNIIITYLKIIFFDVNNFYFIYFILLGIIFKNIKLIKLKNCKYLFIFIILDLFKILFLSYSYIFVVISLLIVLYIEIFKININKYLFYVLYIILPISSFYIINKIYKHHNSLPIIYNITIYFVLSYKYLLYTYSSNNLYKGLILCGFTFFIYENKINKKRNIISIFLFLLILLYFHLY